MINETAKFQKSTLGVLNTLALLCLVNSQGLFCFVLFIKSQGLFYYILSISFFFLHLAPWMRKRLGKSSCSHLSSSSHVSKSFLSHSFLSMIQSCSLFFIHYIHYINKFGQYEILLFVVFDVWCHRHSHYTENMGILCQCCMAGEYICISCSQQRGSNLEYKWWWKKVNSCENW